MSVTGAIKVLGVPDDACITTVRDLILQLEKYLAVEFDEEKITNVIVSNAEPDTTSRDILWYRIDNGGNFVGLYVFMQGQWIQQFPPPNQIVKVYGRSDELEPGYVLLDATIPGFTELMIAKLQEEWYPDPVDEPEYYTIFHVVYVGL